MNKLSWSRKRIAGTVLLLCATAVATQGQILTTLVNFNGDNGAMPGYGALIQDIDGNLYGTTKSGSNGGTVFKVNLGGMLTSFAVTSGTTFEGSPYGGMVLARDGNFYGTTVDGGVYSEGTVFRLSPGGTFTTLYSFCSKPSTAPNQNPNSASCADGGNPYAGLIQASDGNFYGTTTRGGLTGYGTVFKITPGGNLTTLYSFCSQSACADGSTPIAALTQTIDGNFYGTTADTDSNGYGTIFRITTGGALTTLYIFGSVDYDGIGPYAGLVQGFDGNFYGTTVNGGLKDAGTIFKITPAGKLTTVYNFCSQAVCADGSNPFGLIQGTDGNFYGTTYSGGANLLFGTVFKITPGGVLTTLYSFSGPDGWGPDAAPIQGTDGNLYGTTSTGGANNEGTIFKLGLLAPGYTCTNTTLPVITFVDSASGYGGYPYFASGSWLEIKGTNLADPADPRLKAANPGQWTSSDFNGANAPTMLDGISVSINGKSAYVWYLSPTQLNVQAPEDSTTGNVSITVTNCKATSSPFMFMRRPLAPGLLAPTNYSVGGKQYMIATFASDGAYVLNTSAGAAFGLNSRPARPGDLIIAYGIGFGDVTPSILPGVVVGQSNMLVNPVTVSFGSTNATLAYSGLAGAYVGLYEFYFTVPPGLVNGDYQINVAQSGTPVPQTMYLTVHN